MTDRIAYCGLDCAQCPAYVATLNDDQELRATTATRWSQIFSIELKPEDIVCDGCQSTSGRLYGHCQTCSIRACGAEKSVPNCGTCAHYACEKITDFIRSAPEVKDILDSFAALKKAR